MTRKDFAEKLQIPRTTFNHLLGSLEVAGLIPVPCPSSLLTEDFEQDFRKAALLYNSRRQGKRRGQVNFPSLWLELFPQGAPSLPVGLVALPSTSELETSLETNADIKSLERKAETAVSQSLLSWKDGFSWMMPISAFDLAVRGGSRPRLELVAKFLGDNTLPLEHRVTRLEQTEGIVREILQTLAEIYFENQQRELDVSYWLDGMMGKAGGVGTKAMLEEQHWSENQGVKQSPPNEADPKVIDVPVVTPAKSEATQQLPTNQQFTLSPEIQDLIKAELQVQVRAITTELNAQFVSAREWIEREATTQLEAQKKEMVKLRGEVSRMTKELEYASKRRDEALKEVALVRQGFFGLVTQATITEELLAHHHWFLDKWVCPVVGAKLATRQAPVPPTREQLETLKRYGIEFHGTRTQARVAIAMLSSGDQNLEWNLPPQMRQELEGKRKVFDRRNKKARASFLGHVVLSGNSSGAKSPPASILEELEEIYALEGQGKLPKVSEPLLPPKARGKGKKPQL
jgi:hypothetical protein